MYQMYLYVLIVLNIYENLSVDVLDVLVCTYYAKYLGESSCQCTECGWEWTPICGNSRIYDNLCQLKYAACTSDTSISPLPLHICGK